MRNGTTRAGRLVVLGAAVLLVVAACGGGATASPSPTATPTAAPTAAGGELKVTVATDTAAGKYLAGKDGLALYIFKKDTGSTSTCYGDCATAWPPLLVTSADGVKGEDGVGGTFATTDRTDGTKQVTYNGAPLYYFQGDKKAGDVTGQGLNDVWFLAAP
jgi:predicted lipoprotein with Yx(FWY)xxD motif